MLICSLVDFQTFANLSALFIQNIVAMIGKILETPWLPIQRKKYVMATQFCFPQNWLNATSILEMVGFMSTSKCYQQVSPKKPPANSFTLW